MPHLHNALHHATQLQDAYRNAVGEADASFTGIERAGETLTPVIDLWSQPEWRLPRGEIPYAARINVAAVAARFSAMEWVNPAGSDILAVLGGVWTEDVSADLVVDNGGALGVTATFRGRCLDTRKPNFGETSECTIVTGDFAAGGILPVWRTVPTAVPQPHVPLRVVLAPGTKLWIIGNVVNTAVRGAVWWTERRILPGEL